MRLVPDNRATVRELHHKFQIMKSITKRIYSIIFRSLQGIGGSGLYALAVASILDVVPFRYTGHASGAISLASACASVLGPVIGGAITSHTTWRVSASFPVTFEINTHKIAVGVLYQCSHRFGCSRSRCCSIPAKHWPAEN